jgi:hypothetical protein
MIKDDESNLSLSISTHLSLDLLPGVILACFKLCFPEAELKTFVGMSAVQQPDQILCHLNDGEITIVMKSEEFNRNKCLFSYPKHMEERLSKPLYDIRMIL